MNTIENLESEVASAEKERLVVLARCDAKMAKAEAVANPAVRDALVAAAQAQMDSVEAAYSKLIAGRKVAVAQARIAENERLTQQDLDANIRADKQKALARRAWIASGGRGDEFESAWLQILAQRTAVKLDTPQKQEFRGAY